MLGHFLATFGTPGFLSILCPALGHAETSGIPDAEGGHKGLGAISGANIPTTSAVP